MKKRTKKFAKKRITLKKRNKNLRRSFLVKKKRAVKTTKASLKNKKQRVNFISTPPFRAKIKVIGIGGGGGAIVSEIGRSLGKSTFVIADTDTRSFKRSQGIKYFSFGQNLTGGLGTGLNLGLAKTAAEQEAKRIAGFFKNQNIIIFIVSLGGGTGSGAAPVFLEQIPNDFSGITFGIFTLPFKFEGKQKQRIAARALWRLVKHLNVSLVIPNERIFKVISQGTPITKAFSLVNKNLAENLEGLINLIYSPGVINVDFADLRTILKGRGNLAFLNTVEASGKDRLEKITKSILNNQLYRNSNFKPEKMLFNIQGGNKLSMFQVDKISQAISNLNPKAKIIFGISKNSKYENKIKATLLMTGSSSKGKESVVMIKKSQSAAAVKMKKAKKSKKIQKKITRKKTEQKIPFWRPPVPIFNESPSQSFSQEEILADLSPRKLNIVEKAGLANSPHQMTDSKANQHPTSESSGKKTFRRTALQIKKDEEREQKKQSQQEKEWEIPAFLRRFKFRP